MTAEGPRRFMIAGEDGAHARVVPRLADRLLVDVIDWLEEETLEHVRTWDGKLGGKEDSEPPYPVKHALDDARARRLPVHGHFGGEAGLPEARMFRALFYLCQAEGDVDAVVVARDMDRDPRRRDGFAQAKSVTSWAFKIVLAAPYPETEAWEVAGFEAEDEDERARLDALKKELGFLPTKEPHQLTAQPNTLPTDAKRVLGRLTGADESQRRISKEAQENRAQKIYARRIKLTEGPLETLEARGQAAGVPEFFRAVREELAPLIG